MANETLQEMLNDVSDSQDKRPGSFIYDSLKPASKQFNKTDKKIETVEGKLSIENLYGDELKQRVKERTGLDHRDATSAIGTVTLTGTGTINKGDLFETENGIQFEATETKQIEGSGHVYIKALVKGPNGEVPAGTITLFPVTLAGFTDVVNEEPTYDGFEEESREDLIQRYYEAKRRPSTSGNKAHYIAWAKEVEGVGEVKAFPLWNGNNTVKVLIIDSNRYPASNELVETVQVYIDPEMKGEGEGAAPIGAFVTVESADGLDINIGVDVVLSEGFNAEDVKLNIEESLTQYLFGIAFKETIVSYARAGAAILASNGVEDYSNLTINGGTTNITINSNEVAILGAVTINAT